MGVAAGPGVGGGAVGLGVVGAAGCGWGTAWVAYAQVGGEAGAVAAVAAAGVEEVVVAAVTAAARRDEAGVAGVAGAGTAPSRKGVEVWGAAPSAAAAGRAASAWR